MRKVVLGSYNARGKKKRKNIRKFTPSVPRTAAITNRRRRVVAFCASSSDLEKMLRSASRNVGFPLREGASVPAGDSIVGLGILSPGPGFPVVHLSMHTGKRPP